MKCSHHRRFPRRHLAAPGRPRGGPRSVQRGTDRPADFELQCRTHGCGAATDGRVARSARIGSFSSCCALVAWRHLCGRWLCAVSWRAWCSAMECRRACDAVLASRALALLRGVCAMQRTGRLRFAFTRTLCKPWWFPRVASCLLRLCCWFCCASLVLTACYISYLVSSASPARFEHAPIPHVLQSLVCLPASSMSASRVAWFQLGLPCE